MVPKLPSLNSINQLLYSSTKIPCCTCVASFLQVRRYASRVSAGAKARKVQERLKAKRAIKTHFTQYDLKDADQFSLEDAMRYIRAFEVGQNPVSVKYDIAIKIRTPKTGPTVKNVLKLPTPVKTDMRICVFAEGDDAVKAKAAGAAVVGTTDLWEEIRNGRLDFDRCIAHPNVMQGLNKAKLGKILGPKGMMPSPKFGTVNADVATAVRALVGRSEYRERLGVVRMSVGQLGFTIEQLQRNIKYLVEAVKKDLNQIDLVEKSIHEIVLSSTNSPGFSLSGEVRKVIKEEEEAISDDPTKAQNTRRKDEIPHIATMSDDIQVGIPAMA